jgi:hypothetical protein
LSHEVVPGGVGSGHEVRDEEFLLRLVRLGGDHVPDGFVEGVDLEGGEVGGDALEVAEDLVDERFLLARLLHDEVATAPTGGRSGSAERRRSGEKAMLDSLLSDLDERVASHVLNTLVRLVGELEELVDDRLEELPVRLEEARVLTDDVHDVGGAARWTGKVNMKNGKRRRGEEEGGRRGGRDAHDGLVVLPTLHLRQPEKVCTSRPFPFVSVARSH